MVPTWSDCLQVDEATEERFINPENIPLLKFHHVHLCGVMKAKKHYLIRRTRPGFHIFLYTIKGQAQLLTPEQSIPITENSLSVLPADSVSGYQLTGDIWECAWLGVDSVEQWSTLAQREPMVMYSEQAVSIYHLMQALYHELKQQQNGSEAAAGCASLMLDLVHRSLADQTAVDAVEVRLKQLFCDVENQLHYPWSVEELANNMHYSVPHFHRICHKYLNQSPKQYLLGLKMTRAKQLLLGHNLSIKQVAFSLGYEDVSYFSNRFKKHFGVAPGAIQRSDRGNHFAESVSSQSK